MRACAVARETKNGKQLFLQVLVFLPVAGQARVLYLLEDPVGAAIARTLRVVVVANRLTRMLNVDSKEIVMNVSMRRTGGLAWAMGCALACLGFPGQLAAQCEVQKLNASDGAPNDEFGVSVSVSGDVALVGAESNGCAAGIQCGAAYVYRFNGVSWIEEQKLTAFDATPRDFFGVSVSISGDVAIVGAPQPGCANNVPCGAAYVYRFNGIAWVQEQKLTGSDLPGDSRFGRSVSVDGNVVVVGAYLSYCAVGYCGAAYVFRFNGVTWLEEQRLTASDAAGNDRFGISVSVNDGVALVGAPGVNCAGSLHSDCGAAYFYRFDGLRWVEEQKLIPSDAFRIFGRLFGRSVSVNGDLALVGAYADACPYSNCGAVYFYRFNGVTWVKTLEQASFLVYEQFGRSVSVSGDVVVIGGGPGFICNVSSNCAAAYLFRFSGGRWVREEILRAHEADAFPNFGFAVATSGDVVIVGALSGNCDEDEAEACGSAYVYALGPDCNANGEADLCDIRDGRSRDVDGDGVPDECEVITAALDIKPGACPNPFNPKSHGVLPTAVVGSPTFDVTQIDTDSLVLKRSDGVGGSVRQLSGPPGPGIRFEDVATPFSGPECGCNDLGADGLEDLTLKFSAPDLAQALQLSSFAAGASVELTLSGTLRDGTPFRASDCIVLPGAAVTHLSVEVADEPSAIPIATSRHSHAETVPIPVGRTDPKD